MHYLDRPRRDLPDVAEMYRAEIERRERSISHLEAQLAHERACLADCQARLDMVQGEISCRLRSHGLLRIIDG